MGKAVMSAGLFAVDKIIQGHGSIEYSALGFVIPDTTTYEPLRHGLPNVDARYQRCKAVISGNTIKLSAVKSDDATANTVNILYEGDQARFGWLDRPGYIYSDGFSGCAFYLFRSAAGDRIFGVHASRQSGRLIDPIPAFRQAGYKLLWFWDSLGAQTDAQLLSGSFSAVFCYVDSHTIAAYAIRIQNRRIEAMLSRNFIPSYNRFELPDPVTKMVQAVPVSGLQRLKKLLNV
jgi:hypothetical protein